MVCLQYIVWDSFYTFLNRGPQAHLGLFVHRVNGIEPGLYILIRDASQLDTLKRQMTHGKWKFEWEKPKGSSF